MEKNNSADGLSSKDENMLKKNTELTETDSKLSRPATIEIGGIKEQTPIVAQMVTEPEAEEYRMNHPRRGKAIIFNQKHFDDKKHKVRLGTEYDVKKIKEVFGDLLKFEIKEYHDLEAKKIIDTVEELSKEDHSECDCVAIFILSHGEEGGDISAKDELYHFEDICKWLTGKKCVTLVGKPKLFFINTCRGEKMDEGIAINSKTQIDSSRRCRARIPYKIPLQADFLIAKSTVEGYVSFRDEGTWFIQSLCDIVSQHYETTDLLKMLIKTSRKVAMEYRSVSDDPTEHDQTQVPEIQSTLIRDVYFRNK